MSCAQTIEYYLSAASDGGTIVTEPLDAPADLHRAWAVDLEDLLNDDFEQDLGWEAVVENPGTTDGGWVRVIPVETTAQPGFDYSPDAGAYAYITGQNIPGQSGVHDVDGGPVRLLSPIISIDVSDAEISYARWFHSSVSTEPDELIVDFSRDNGATWTVVETVAPTNAWEVYSFRLSEFPQVTGSQLRVRFSVADTFDDPSLTEAAIDEFHVRAIRCTALKGDFDGDGRLTLTDFAHLHECLTGPGTPYSDGGCATFDFENDADVDLVDSHAFQTLFDPS
jgi:hypothetical protein